MSKSNTSIINGFPINSNSKKEALQIMNIIKKTSQKLTKAKAIELYEEYSEKFIPTKPEERAKFDNIINENSTCTPKDKQEAYWQNLKQIIGSFKKTSTKYSPPVLPFGKYLDDLDFLDLVKNALNYACYSQSNELLNYMKDKFSEIEKYTQNIFMCPNILKDIKKNGILSIISGETFKEKKEGVNLLKINNSTITPLIKLEFSRDNKNYDLDKEELYNILTSKVLLKFYKDNFADFIPNFIHKIKNDEEIKQYMKYYLDHYNFYFCDLPSNTMAITIYTGNIYLKSIYLKEYFLNINNEIINQDDSIIIREKIILNIKHEMNHALLRIIDDEKKENFFLKSKNSNSKNKYVVFQEKLNKNIFHNYPVDESGVCFDYKLYRGYYFDNLFKNEANFFLDIQNLKDENEYVIKFDEMMQKKGIDYYSDNSINKFKIIDDENPHCIRAEMISGNLFH